MLDPFSLGTDQIVVRLIDAESASGRHRLADVTVRQRDNRAGQDGGRGGADWRWGAVGERAAVLGQPGEVPVPTRVLVSVRFRNLNLNVFIGDHNFKRICFSQ